MSLRGPDHFLGISRVSAAAAIGDVIGRFDDVLIAERPDAVLIYGDTNSGLGAIAAKRRRVPVFHMEAGNRSFDARVPEEVNRRIIDHISDVNMTNSERARSYLLAEGLRPETVIRTGSPMLEVITHHRPRIEASTVLAELGLERSGFVLVSAHREENVDSPDALRRLVATLERVAEASRLPVIVSTHPRTRNRLAAAQIGDVPGVRFLDPFGFFDYVHLQMSAYCVLSDSGTITEESTLLQFPAVMLREAHERPEGIDVGALPFVGLDPEAVTDAMCMVVHQHTTGRVPPAVPDYEAPDVSGTVLQVIVSFVQYLRRTVWFGAPPTWT